MLSKRLQKKNRSSFPTLLKFELIDRAHRSKTTIQEIFLKKLKDSEMPIAQIFIIFTL